MNAANIQRRFCFIGHVHTSGTAPHLSHLYRIRIRRPHHWLLRRIVVQIDEIAVCVAVDRLRGTMLIQGAAIQSNARGLMNQGYPLPKRPTPPCGGTLPPLCRPESGKIFIFTQTIGHPRTSTGVSAKWEACKMK